MGFGSRCLCISLHFAVQLVSLGLMAFSNDRYTNYVIYFHRSRQRRVWMIWEYWSGMCIWARVKWGQSWKYKNLLRVQIEIFVILKVQYSQSEHKRCYKIHGNSQTAVTATMANLEMRILNKAIHFLV